MSKQMAISHIEQEIEAMPPVEQIMMIERIVRHLKKLLVAPAEKNVACKSTTEKLNHIYQVEESGIDSKLYNAQLSSIGRDEW